MNSEPSEQIIVITGDVTMDWNLARTPRSKRDVSSWSADDTTSTSWQRGGAALLADLIEAIAGDLQRNGSSQVSIRQTGAPAMPIVCTRTVTGITIHTPCGLSTSMGINLPGGSRSSSAWTVPQATPSRSGRR